jgi:hypothetical protein
MCRFQAQEIEVCPSPGSGTSCGAFKRRADFVDVQNFLGGGGSDLHAPSAPFNELFNLEPEERFSDRRTARAVAGCHSILAERVAWFKMTAQNIGPDLVIYAGCH